MGFKSKSEKLRLEMNAKAQAVLIRNFYKKDVIAAGKPIERVLDDIFEDIYEPEGEIDYTRFKR